MPWLEKAYPGFTAFNFSLISENDQVPEFLLTLQMNLQGRSALKNGYIDASLTTTLTGGVEGLVFYTRTPP